MRVALADDSTLFREGLAQLLVGQGREVVLQARSGDELLALLPRGERPDVVVLDLRMPPTFTDEGLTTAIAIRERHPDVAVLLLSTYAETAYAARLLEATTGGVGYLLKDSVSDVSALGEALDRVAGGGTVVDPELVRRLLTSRRRAEVLSGLTDRERQVLELMAEGRSNAGIANELHLGVKTVERHIASLLNNLRVTGGSNDNRRVLAVLTWLRASQGQDPRL